MKDDGKGRAGFGWGMRWIVLGCVAVVIVTAMGGCKRRADESRDDTRGVPQVVEPGAAGALEGPAAPDREARRPPPPMPQYRSESQSDVPVPLAAAAGTSQPSLPPPPTEPIGMGESDAGDPNVPPVPAPTGETAGATSSEGAAGAAAPAGVADPEAADQLGRSGDLTIERFVLCEDIEDREPVGATRSFARSGDGKIWAFIHAANAGSDTRKLSVTFESLDRAGASTAPIELDIPPGPRYRTWAWATTSRPAGRYRAIVRDESGAVVARGRFEVVE